LAEIWRLANVFSGGSILQVAGQTPNAERRTPNAERRKDRSVTLY
jgi:hypothetical protein